MPPALFDAHCHRPYPHGAVAGAVINTTGAHDWPTAVGDSLKETNQLAAIGLHPWLVRDAKDDWAASFQEHLEQSQAVGEIGLDASGKAGPMDAQAAAFRYQLEAAAARNLPVSIHCLKAWDALFRSLDRCPLPSRGFHLHAFAGSAQQVEPLAQRGAYFSFHAGQLSGRARKAPEALLAVPANRLLIESDAPHPLGPDETALAFLQRSYARAAELRGVAPEALAAVIGDNFRRFFGQA